MGETINSCIVWNLFEGKETRIDFSLLINFLFFIDRSNLNLMSKVLQDCIGFAMLRFLIESLETRAISID